MVYSFGRQVTKLCSYSKSEIVIDGVLKIPGKLRPSFLAHLSRRRVGELIVYPWSGIRPSSTISNRNISATSRLITMKFYQKHHWDRGKAALGFGPDWIKTLVSMATDSYHRVILEKTVLLLFLSCFYPILFILAGNDSMHGSS